MEERKKNENSKVLILVMTVLGGCRIESTLPSCMQLCEPTSTPATCVQGVQLKCVEPNVNASLATFNDPALALLVGLLIF